MVDIAHQLLEDWTHANVVIVRQNQLRTITPWNATLSTNSLGHPSTQVVIYLKLVVQHLSRLTFDCRALNVDVSNATIMPFSNQLDITGIVMFLCDKDGAFVLARTLCFTHFCLVDVSEAI